MPLPHGATVLEAHEQALALMQMLSPMCETTTVADLLA
ncbi:hypothetical protein ACVWWH_001134 [Sinomonas sp. RB5]